MVLRTINVAEMVRFYRDVLGCRVERSLPPATGLTQLRAGDALIDIVLSSKAQVSESIPSEPLCTKPAQREAMFTTLPRPLRRIDGRQAFNT